MQNAQNFDRKLSQKIVPEEFTGKTVETYLCALWRLSNVNLKLIVGLIMLWQLTWHSIISKEVRTTELLKTTPTFLSDVF